MKPLFKTDSFGKMVQRYAFAVTGPLKPGMGPLSSMEWPSMISSNLAWAHSPILSVPQTFRGLSDPLLGRFWLLREASWPTRRALT